jgi:hypothetical protein
MWRFTNAQPAAPGSSKEVKRAGNLRRNNPTTRQRPTLQQQLQQQDLETDDPEAMCCCGSLAACLCLASCIGALVGIQLAQGAGTH